MQEADSMARDGQCASRTPAAWKKQRSAASVIFSLLSATTLFSGLRWGLVLLQVSQYPAFLQSHNLLLAVASIPHFHSG
jgi:hypothetical protein